MFDLKNFSNILKKITNTYSSISEFAEKSNVNRTYLSKYINMKLIEPPTPKILKKIADNSNGIVSYYELMVLCGYVNYNSININKMIDNFFVKNPNMKFTLNKEKLKTRTVKEEVTLQELFESYRNILVHSNMEEFNYDNFIKDLPQSSKIKVSIIWGIYIKYLDEAIKTNSPINMDTKEQNLLLVPILGKIAAGKPILAQEYIEGYLPVDPNIYGLSTSDELFYLRVSGQSMNLKVKNGDYALIRKQDYAEDGDIIAAIVNGDDEATLKRYKKLNEQFVLLEPMSTDPSIEAITVDLKNTDFKILGKAIGQFGKF